MPWTAGWKRRSRRNAHRCNCTWLSSSFAVEVWWCCRRDGGGTLVAEDGSSYENAGSRQVGYHKERKVMLIRKTAKTDGWHIFTGRRRIWRWKQRKIDHGQRWTWGVEAAWLFKKKKKKTKELALAGCEEPMGCVRPQRRGLYFVRLLCLLFSAL